MAEGCGVSADLLRESCGLEPLETIIAAFEEALAHGWADTPHAGQASLVRCLVCGNSNCARHRSIERDDESLLTAIPIHSLKNKRVLVVDDNEAIHDDFRKILILGVMDSSEADFNAEVGALSGTGKTEAPAPGFDLDFASQGRDALALVTAAVLAEKPYAMVFMDEGMPPGWDGINTTARLWEVDPNLQVVICTAHSDPSRQSRIAGLGGSDRLLILKKPFDISEVFQLAHTLTTKWTLQQESRCLSESLELAVKTRTHELELEMTERKRSEGALKFTQFSVDHASDAMCWVAADSRLIYVNAAACRSLGYAEDELRALSILDTVPLLRQDGWQTFWNALRTEQHRTLETEHLTKDGRRIPIELTVNFFDFAGREFMCASARDITRRREILAELSNTRDLALESVRIKGRFLANMSHEIRTPMNGVVGMAELLLHTNLDREQREFVDVIRSSAHHLLDIINDILDFSKIDSGQLHIETKDFDLRKIIEDALDVVAPLARKKGLELAGCVKPEVAHALRGDCGRLTQVLTNLLGNAVKFTGTGEVTLEVSRAASSSNRNLLEFEIRDTGIGIDLASQQKIFEPFHQADGSDTRKYGGTGLGLAICNQIISSMGGQLGVESVPGVGSRFWFTLEFEPGGDPPPAATTLIEPAGLRALVVDDSATNRRILQAQLANFQLQPITAASGPEALEHLRAGVVAGTPFHIAIVDMQMPGMDGLALATAVRAEPAFAATRVIILSSLGDQISPAALEAAGVQDYLVKPVKQSRLEISLARVLGLEPRPLPVAAESATPASAPRHAARILLAEDNSVNQMVALLQLRRLGYQVDSVTDGAQVLAALETTPYDIILMDCQMPVLDGYAATRQIRRDFPGSPIRIIAMTANAMTGDREKCLEAGMDDHLSKPVDIGMLEKILTRWQPAAPAVLPDDATPAVDLVRLLQITGKDPRMFRDITGQYLEQAEEILALMRLALEKPDLPEIQRLAHKLGGSSAVCGMVAIMPPLAKLERMPESVGPVFAGDLLRQASAQLRTIRRFLTAHAQTLNSVP